MDTSCREHPKNRDRSQYSGSSEGEGQGSKEVAEEMNRVLIVEDRRVVQEKEIEREALVEV